MLLLLVCFPLFNAIYIWILELFVGKRKAILFVAHVYLLGIIISFNLLWSICISTKFYFATLGSWVKCGLFIVNWGFIFDTLTIIMLSMVVFISGLVHFYSIGYMEKDISLIRFISYLSLFTFFMFILVSGDNFIQLFLGWEGIGLSSYLLISFWNTRVQANKASLKALIVNRIGDFGFLCGVCFIFYFFRSVDFSVIFILTTFFKDFYFSALGFQPYCLDSICLFLFLGSMGKSAQIGLHTWLPDAMEGESNLSCCI